MPCRMSLFFWEAARGLRVRAAAGTSCLLDHVPGLVHFYLEIHNVAYPVAVLHGLAAARAPGQDGVAKDAPWKYVKTGSLWIVSARHAGMSRPAAGLLFRVFVVPLALALCRPLALLPPLLQRVGRRRGVWVFIILQPAPKRFVLPCGKIIRPLQDVCFVLQGGDRIRDGAQRVLQLAVRRPAVSHV